MRQAVFLQRPDHLQDGGHARLVVAAQDGRAVGVDHAVADHRLDADVLADGVHVRAEHQPVALARPAGDQVPVLVGLDRAAQLGQPPRQVFADGLFLARRAVDGDQVEEGFK